MNFPFPLPKVFEQKIIAQKLLNRQNSLPIEVAICTRNRSAKLKIVIASLMRTQPLPKKILVIDSSESLDESLLHFYKKFNERPQLTYFLIEHQGIAQSRNFALNAVASPYFSFLDDDTNVPRKYTQTINELLVKKDVDVLIGHFRPTYSSNYWNQLWAVIWPEFTPYEVNPGGAIISAGISAYRTKLLQNKKIFFNPYMRLGGEEEEFSERVQKYTQKISYNPKFWVYHDFRTTFYSFGVQFFTYGVTACLRFLGTSKSKRENLLHYMKYQHSRNRAKTNAVELQLLPGLFFKNATFWTGFFLTFLYKKIRSLC